MEITDTYVGGGITVARETEKLTVNKSRRRVTASGQDGAEAENTVY